MTIPPLSIGAIRIYQGERAHQNLEYSVTLDVIPRRGKPEVAAAVREILPQSGLQANKPVREALSIVVANLFAAWATHGNPFLAMPMRSADYAPGSRLRALWLKFKPTTAAVHALHKAGYIELYRGIYFEAESRRTRIRASEKLVALFVRHRFNLASVEALDKELVQLRGPKINGKQGKPIGISRGVHAATAQPFKEVVRRINAALSAASIELHLAEQVYIEHYVKRPNGKKTPIPPHPLRNQLCRVFNVDFDHGGRFYRHWAQGIPRELRRFIRINGKPVMELDFKAIHPTLLYAERGLTFEGEVYVPPGWPDAFRPVFKLLMLAAINADDLADAVKGARDGLRCDPGLLAAFPECLKDGWLVPAFDALAKLHKPIAGEFFTGAGLRLQRKDSEVAERVMLTLLDRGVVAVPVHDSFLVAHPHTDILREAMLAASKDVSGVAIPVDEKWPFSTIQQTEIMALSQESAPVMDREALPRDFQTPSTFLDTGGVSSALSTPRRPQGAAA
ncbi:MAG: hypothetical protein A2051_14215 [Desulfovibrionales bacterium GWA2_65_9]|nr:MAG: hypothetical protein A2051_14215 [Desulfovibrionales bacterium GWA2_65_9]